MLYFFDVGDDQHHATDIYGVECASDDEACREARTLALEVLTECGLDLERRRVSVDLHRGLNVCFYRVSLAFEALCFEPAPPSDRCEAGSPDEPRMLPISPMRNADAPAMPGAGPLPPDDRDR